MPKTPLSNSTYEDVKGEIIFTINGWTFVLFFASAERKLCVVRLNKVQNLMATQLQ